MLDWLLKIENKKTCRAVGIFFVIPCIAYYFIGGFSQGIDEDTFIFSKAWFHNVLVISLILIFMIGLLLVWAGFLKRNE